MSIKLNIQVATDKGKLREINEDNYCINRHFKKQTADADIYRTNSKHNTIAAIFDGIGGEDCGEIASFIAAKTTARFDGFLPDDDWNIILNHINERIVGYGTKSNRSLGCTAAMLYYRDGLADICNLGDSRIYLYRDNSLSLLSKDHTEYQRAVDMGLTDFDVNNSGISKNKLVKYLGIDCHELNPFIKRNLEVAAGDMFIICSDGLTDMVADDDILKILLNKNPENCCIELIKEALNNGGRDNVTVITAYFTEAKSLFDFLKPK